MKYSIILTFIAISLVISSIPTTAQQLTSTTTIYVPILSSNKLRPFGVEPNTGWLYNLNVKTQAAALNANWVRLNTISWR
ncbi:MAG: hypothetical protein K6356_00055, partial [Chloroflexus sp.]